MKETIVKANKTKSCYFEKIKYKHLARLIKKKERELLSHQDKYYFNVIFKKIKISARKRIHDNIFKR